ncbi:MAG: AAA family ATPase [Pseudomonadales bacterium]|nr:AAA family ATPase [Pseudomonadales bacterium]
MKKYTEALNLTFDPFEPAANSKEFFAGGNRQQLLDQLIEHSLYSQSMMAVTGCLGCGKTMLANTFCQSFGDEAVCVMVPATLFMNKSQFLEKLAEQIPVHLSDEESDSAVISIQSYAAQLDLEAKSLMIVIGDAHELSIDVLNLATSLIANSASGIHILLLGEKQLVSMLQNAVSAEAGQLVVDFEMSELGGEDTVEYVKFKLAEAGFAGELPISGSELGNIHNSANGIPGTINALIANTLESSSLELPASENLPAFVSSGNRYWAIAAVLVVILVTVFVVLDPDPRIEQQQAIATSERPIDIPLAAQSSEEINSGDEGNSAQVESEEPPFTAILETEEAVVDNSETSNAVIPDPEPVEELTPVVESSVANVAAVEAAAEAELPEVEISEFEQSLLEIPGSAYTVQIMGSHSETNVQRFVEDELPSNERGYFETRFQDKPWFVVVLGRFENRADATKAIEDLPASLQSLQPWIRTIADIQSDIRELNSIN